MKKIKEFELAIINFNLEKASELVKELLALKVQSSKIFELISNAMNIVGQKYEAGEVVKEVLRMIHTLIKNLKENLLVK